ncbi:MAG: hypothetical protein FJ280_10660 [Planctomycetes bacterium]|nr:hypothetical protein [Planctomycetota bacterium]
MTFLQVEFLTVRGRVVSFVVRLMRAMGGRWLNVVRYDTAHGLPHRDLLDRHGRIVRKDWLLEMPFDQALTYAKNDLETNYERYCEAFEKR